MPYKILLQKALFTSLPMILPYSSKAGAHVHIDHFSPGVRNRTIFGGLLPFDEVWQAGAHMATWMETDKDLRIEGEKFQKADMDFLSFHPKKIGRLYLTKIGINTEKTNMMKKMILSVLR